MFFIKSSGTLRGTLYINSHLIIGSDLYVCMGVLAARRFGITIFFLSKPLSTIYLIFISSIFPFALTFPANSTISQILNFLLVSIKIQETILAIVVSIANHILKEIHHITIAVSSPIIFSTTKALNIISITNKIDQIKFVCLSI